VRINAVQSTLYGKNTVTLEFTKAQNQPGLLERISKVFSQRQINLTGIFYVPFDDEHLQFTIGFEQSRSSDEVRRALEEIEAWSTPRVRVLIES
jgi:prephenate dehydratase